MSLHVMAYRENGVCLFIPRNWIGKYGRSSRRVAELLEPISVDTSMVSEENLPAAIAILRFNGIEVEVEK